MKARKANAKGQKDVTTMGTEKELKSISYRLKCAKTANGLSHFVMYGDVPEKKTLL